MPFTCSVAEYADTIYVYGFCDGNSVDALAEYQQRFPNRRIPTWRVFIRVYQTLRDTGTLPEFALQPSVMLMQASMKKKALFRWYRAVHVRVREELEDFVFPTRECGEHFMQRARIHTTCSECNISDLTILLRGSNFASGKTAIASCVVTACLLTNRNSIATVSIIQTIHMCGQLRITMPLCKATFNNVLVSKSGVQFWTISCLAISSWKVVIQEKRTSDFCKRNCPEVWRMCF